VEEEGVTLLLREQRDGESDALRGIVRRAVPALCELDFESGRVRTTAMCARGVHDSSPEPGLERPLPAKGLPLAHGRGERVLDDVKRRLAVADDRCCDASELRQSLAVDGLDLPKARPFSPSLITYLTPEQASFL
jgi:hypothetical protein